MVTKSRLSTAQTLSLATTGVVVAVLATAMAVVWLTLTRSAIDGAQDGVDRSVRQFVTVSATGLRTALPRYAKVAADSAVRDALTNPGSAPNVKEIQASLETLATPSDSGLPVELWNAQGRRLAFVGDDSTQPLTLNVTPERGAQGIHQRGLDSLRPADSLQIGALERVGDRTLFWIVLPVHVNGTLLGFVAQRRRIATNPQTEATIRELSGNSATGYYRNVDGSNWTSLGGAPESAPDTATIRRKLMRSRPGLGPVVFSERRIPGTPLVIGMEVPRDNAVAGANASVRHLAVLSVALTVIGAIFAWLIGQRVARPLVDLTDAAESVARGDYSARVPLAGSEEIARLASSFNRMAGQVGESRALLESSEAELRTMSDTIPQLAWMADGDGTVFWFNKRWNEYTGNAEPRSPSIWIDAHDPADVPELLRRWKASLESGEPLEMEVRLRNNAGERRWFLTRVVPVRHHDGRVSRWFGTSTDIQTLRDAREAAEAGNRAKSDFLAAMSHELRTPLNAIGGYAELMELGLRGPVSEEQRRDLARIRASQAHLLGLIGSLLDLSRIESGHVAYDLASIAVDPFLAGLEALVLPQAIAKHQTLVYQPCGADLAVFADREKLRQIMLNLLTNAVRYSPADASITLSAERRDPASVAIKVTDTGPGIPPNRRRAIFEPFVQLDRSLTHSSEGVGLGLAISRDLAHGMNGELSVTSTLGEGSCFEVILPAAVFDQWTQVVHTSETPSSSGIV